MEINTRRLERNPRVRVLTGATVRAAREGAAGREVAVALAPAYVSERCTSCGKCAEVCPGRVTDTFNHGMSEAKAIRLPHPYAWPKRFVLDRDACPPDCRACAEVCEPKAIELDAHGREETLTVGSVVVATGWHPYPLERLPELGGGLPDVISNVQMERLASPSGPTGGRIVRPSDGAAPKRVAFVQCAGSRDVTHLPYCSAVCCLASLKHALYVKEQLPEAEVAIFYIDRRAPGRNEDMLTRVAATEGVRFVKGKVAKVTRSDGTLRLHVEDVDAGRLLDAEADLVVLATGMVPNALEGESIAGLARDDDGFALEAAAHGLVVAGVARRPEDVAASVRDATGAAARAIAAGRRA
jgi:quinone-modifying oxidoreductase subunit QmoA